MTLTEAIGVLKNAGVEDAAHDARIIFKDIGRISDTELFGGNPVADKAVEEAILRRKEREPLQYILGAVDFYRERYKVTEDCLIPRPETELLVELAVKLLPAGAVFADLCTGSGCIAISVLKNTRDTSAFALELSERALDLARYNAAQNGVVDRIEFIHKDVLSAVPRGKVFAVLSNPPYVTDEAFSALAPEIYREPRMAFIGSGEDGADFYREIVRLWYDSVEENGFFLFEIGHDQKAALLDIANKYALECEIKKDYSGHDRIALLRKG